MRNHYLQIFLSTPLIICLSCTIACGKKSPQTPPEDLRASFRRPDTHSQAKHGKVLYDYYCAGCHGDDGRGNGQDTMDDEHPAPDLLTSRSSSTDSANLKCTYDFATMQYHGELQKNELLDMLAYLHTLKDE